MKLKGSELKYPTTSDCVGISNSTCWKEQKKVPKPNKSLCWHFYHKANTQITQSFIQSAIQLEIL